MSAYWKTKFTTSPQMRVELQSSGMDVLFRVTSSPYRRADSTIISGRTLATGWKSKDWYQSTLMLLKSCNSIFTNYRRQIRQTKIGWRLVVLIWKESAILSKKISSSLQTVSYLKIQLALTSLFTSERLLGTYFQTRKNRDSWTASYNSSPSIGTKRLIWHPF